MNHGTDQGFTLTFLNYLFTVESQCFVLRKTSQHTCSCIPTSKTYMKRRVPDIPTQIFKGVDGFYFYPLHFYEYVDGCDRQCCGRILQKNNTYTWFLKTKPVFTSCQYRQKFKYNTRDSGATFRKTISYRFTTSEIIQIKDPKITLQLTCK